MHNYTQEDRVVPASTYINRTLEPVLKRAVKEFPAVVLTGPRQSGKTTTLKHLFGGKYGYVSLEPPDIRLSAASDPRGFLEAHHPPVIFDEVQYAPELLVYVKERIDAHRDIPGQYLLTGSRNLVLSAGVTETLAGRAAILRLLPLSCREMAGVPQRRLPWEKGGPQRASTGHDCDDEAGGRLWETFLRGGYPELAAAPKRDASLWHSGYVQTYLERDVRSLKQVGDLTQFQNFLRMLAARSGQLLNLTDLSRDLGIAVNTAKAWLSILEATFQVIVLRPYFANVGKRLVKTPKVYFTDVGTLCYLSGLKDPEHAASGPMAGAIMETAVVSEIVKTFVHRGEEPRVSFWRTSAGVEVDIVIEQEGRLIPVEVKTSATPKPAMAKSIATFREDLGEQARPGYVVHAGKIRLPLMPSVEAVPFSVL